jgi:threonine/homoserine/homoserine lactone efflux protein
MSIAVYLAFVFASAVMIAIPGPNVTLIVSTSVTQGRRAGLLTVVGTSTAMALQLSLTVAGLTALLGAMANWFEWLRWAGVAYLFYLGIRTWREIPAAAAVPQPLVRQAVFRGFVVSLSNPKTLFLFSAFLPQFAAPGANFEMQLAILSATFLAIAILFDSTWAMAASRARGLLVRAGRFRNRLAGGLLIGAGLGLALARKG